ncbi:hypothetical protein E2542_SST08315 [Spatholobus suberectus]|nr:hypothetical protein E2542_SST08315 [Spatholobus suberectus]
MCFDWVVRQICCQGKLIVKRGVPNRSRSSILIYGAYFFNWTHSSFTQIERICAHSWTVTENNVLLLLLLILTVGLRFGEEGVEGHGAVARRRESEVEVDLEAVVAVIGVLLRV